MLHRMCKHIFPAQPVFDAHGGPSALAKLLKYKVQRVSNWRGRGIPALEVALRPDLFAPALDAAREQEKEAA